MSVLSAVYSKVIIQYFLVCLRREINKAEMFRAGSGHFFSGPDRACVFQPRACAGCRFWPIFGQFLPFLTDFSARSQFLKFGLDRATQNLARVRPLKNLRPVAKFRVGLDPALEMFLF